MTMVIINVADDDDGEIAVVEIKPHVALLFKAAEIDMDSQPRSRKIHLR